MGLVNARNLRKAKQLLEQNRHKVGDIVGKATEKLDQVSNGKTANLSKKAEEAARKYSAGATVSSSAPGAPPAHAPASPPPADAPPEPPPAT
ncbi:MAG: antitoxin [Ilumatobacter sp.]|nr:antitoxin [Ilumatobacter sp.]